MGKFILSFDCEGRWGMHHFGVPCDHVSASALVSVHNSLLESLDRHEIAATFAFVGASMLTRDEVLSHPAWFGASPARDRDWFAPLRRALDQGKAEEWLYPEAFEATARSGAHEIASHGFSHVLLCPEAIDEAAFDRELECVTQVGRMKGCRFRTLVYPLNRVGYCDRLPRHAIVAYRAASRSEQRRGAIGRAIRLFEEFNIFERSQSAAEPGVPMPIPAGRYLNHRHGLRKLVPGWLTARKMAFMLDHAIEHDRVVHIYAHPQEFLTDPAHFNLLDKVLGLVAQRVKSGELRVYTQASYHESHLAL